MAEINPADYVIVEDKDSRLYLAKSRSIFGLKRDEQLYELHERNAIRPTIRKFSDLILLLNSRKSVFDGNEQKINTLERKRILDDIFRRGMTWQAENLDNEFFGYRGQLFMAYDFRIINGKISYSRKEIEPLKEDGKIKLKDLNEDGLAKRVGKGDIDYYYPRKNAVAWFLAYSSRANLLCGWDPEDSNSSLGVRVARENFEI